MSRYDPPEPCMCGDYECGMCRPRYMEEDVFDEDDPHDLDRRDNSIAQGD